jgi:hypothetical protein
MAAPAPVVASLTRVRDRLTRLLETPEELEPDVCLLYAAQLRLCAKQVSLATPPRPA